jgi:hypothetical protein
VASRPLMSAMVGAVIIGFVSLVDHIFGGQDGTSLLVLPFLVMVGVAPFFYVANVILRRDLLRWQKGGDQSPQADTTDDGGDRVPEL